MFTTLLVCGFGGESCSCTKVYAFATDFGIVEEMHYPYTEQRGDFPWSGFPFRSDMNYPTTEFPAMKKLVTEEGAHEKADFQAQKKHNIGDEEISVKKSPVHEKDKIDERGEDMDSTSSTAETTIFSESDDDDDSSPIVRVCCTYDSEEDYCPDYPNGKRDKAVWEKYYKQIKESEGFDIEDFPGRCWMTTVFPLPYYLDDPKNYNRLKDYASKALKLYNDSNGTNYEVDNMLKVNGGGCSDFIYYLTFTVKNGVDDIFQAKVVEEMDFTLKFPIIRPKPKVVGDNC